MPVDVMKIEFTAEDKTQMVVDAVKNNVQGVSNEVTSVVDRYKGYAAAMVAVFAVKEMIEFAGEVVKSMAALKQMSEVTGASIEALAEFRRVSKLSGTDMDVVQQGLVKLSKGMTDFSSDGGQARNALEQLGIRAIDSAGKLKKPDDVMKEVAVTLAQYKDGAGKTAAVMDIFGKSGAQLLPMLNDLAAQQKQVAAMSEEERAAYEAKLEALADVAERSDEYEKTLTRISSESGKWKSVLVQGMIPALADAAQAFYEVVVNSGGLANELQRLVDDGSIEEWTRLGVVGITVLMDAIEGLWRIVKSAFEVIVTYGKNVADTLYAIGSAGIAIVEGRYRDAWENLKLAPKGVADNMKGLQAEMDATWGPSTAGDRMRQRLAELSAGLGQTGDDLGDLGYKSKQNKDKVDALTTAFNSMVESLGKGSAERAAQIQFMNDFGVSTEATKSALVQYEIEQGKLQGLTVTQQKQLTDMAKQLDDQTATYNAMKDGLAAWKTEVNNALKAADDWQKKQDDIHLKKANYVDAYNDANTALEAQIGLLGSSALAIETYNTKKAAEKEIQDMLNLGLDHEAQRMQEALAARLALIQQKYETQERLDWWNKVGDAAAGFGKALLDGPGAAFTYLKNLAKDLLTQLLEMFAKRFVLQIAASVTGLTGLDAMAGQVGQGTLAGGLLNGAGSFGSSLLGSFGSAISSLGGDFFGGLGSMFGNMAAEGLVSGFTGAFTAGVQSLMAGNVLGGLGTLLGPLGLAVGAIAAIASMFKDAGENPKVQLGFGNNAQAYDWEGVFGKEGFFTIATNDSFNRGLASALKQIGDAFDPAIKTFLDPAKFDQVVATLNTTIAREFAFPKGDNTAGEQVTVDYLKTKYGIIFDALDPVFAQKVHDWSGTAEDLAKAIGTEIQTLQAMKVAVETVTYAMGLVPPSSFDAERALVEAAGGLQQFTSQASFYLKNFYTDAEQQAKTLSDAQKSVTDGFAALGISVPKSKDDFRKLVDSLDLNSASGRSMYTALMGLAPAFVTVANASDAAAAAMLGRWAQVQQITGGDTGTGTGALTTLLGRFRSGHSWADGGQYADNAFLVNQLSMIQQGDFSGYSAADQQLIIDILTAARNAGMLGGNGTSTTTNTGSTATGTGSSSTDTGSSSGGGNYGLTISSTLGAAEWSQSVEDGVKRALAGAGITAAYQADRDGQRFVGMADAAKFCADMLGQLVTIAVRDSGRQVAATERVAVEVHGLTEVAAAGARL